MSDIKKVIVWATVLVVLVIYARSSGLVPENIGTLSTGAVLGEKAKPQTFGDLLDKTK